MELGLLCLDIPEGIFWSNITSKFLNFLGTGTVWKGWGYSWGRGSASESFKQILHLYWNTAYTFSGWCCNRCLNRWPLVTFNNEPCSGIIEQLCQWEYKGNPKSRMVFGFIDLQEWLWLTEILSWGGSSGHFWAQYKWALWLIDDSVLGNKWREGFTPAHKPGLCHLDLKRQSVFSPSLAFDYSLCSTFVLMHLSILVNSGLKFQWWTVFHVEGFFFN